MSSKPNSNESTALSENSIECPIGAVSGARAADGGWQL